MKTKEEKTMQTLMKKMDHLTIEKSVQLSPEEAMLYQTQTMDELPMEDHVKPKIKAKDGN